MTIYEDIYNAHGFSLTQQKILEIVGSEKTVLEIGPSTGYMTEKFLQNNCTIDVVEVDKEAFKKLESKKIRTRVNASIENPDTIRRLKADYDFIILADVLEHTVYPDKVLHSLKSICNKNTKLLISLPNVACWEIRKQLFFGGDFEYKDEGILDKTHLHFYTVNSFPKLVKENGWDVEKLIGTITAVPFERTINRMPIVGQVFKKFIRQNIVQKFNNLTYYHMLLIAKR